MSLCSLGLLNGLEELRGIELEALYLLLEAVDMLVNDLQSLGGLLPVFDLDLDQQAPLAALDGKLLSLIKGVLLLSTDLDSGGHIEDGVLASRS